MAQYPAINLNEGSALIKYIEKAVRKYVGCLESNLAAFFAISFVFIAIGFWLSIFGMYLSKLMFGETFYKDNITLLVVLVFLPFSLYGTFISLLFLELFICCLRPEFSFDIKRRPVARAAILHVQGWRGSDAQPDQRQTTPKNSDKAAD